MWEKTSPPKRVEADLLLGDDENLDVDHFVGGRICQFLTSFSLPFPSSPFVVHDFVPKVDSTWVISLGALNLQSTLDECIPYISKLVVLTCHFLASDGTQMLRGAQLIAELEREKS